MGEQALAMDVDTAETAMSSSTSIACAPPDVSSRSRTPSLAHTHRPRLSKTDSIASVLSAHRNYLDSLPVPSKEEFDHINRIQIEREAEQKRQFRQNQRQQSIEIAQSRRGSIVSENGSVTQAATVIQRTYRGYRARRTLAGLGIDASTRWIHAIREAQWRALTRPRARNEYLDSDSLYSPSFVSSSLSPGDNNSDASSSITLAGTTARLNWKKASTIARRVGGDADGSSSSSSSSSESSSSSSESESKLSKAQKKQLKQRRAESKARRKAESRTMGLQYFLEMIDHKHRYGSNLKVYHEEWQKAETQDNFFYWLDHGEGRILSLEACPRDVLEREQVRYLSREERQAYLVAIDGSGRLCWAKNGVPIDTTEKWKDSINGIVPSDDPTPAYAPVSESNTNFLGDSCTESSRSSSESVFSPPPPPPPVTSPPPAKKSARRLFKMSPTTMLNKLLRHSVTPNTWIFVADTSFRLYVGIKNSGAFQHSSFLQGSRISAAGLIKIKEGKLHSLSPLSGHYRPPASNFRMFVQTLKKEGVDMSKVSISKSYAVLVGLEGYMKVKQRGKEIKGMVGRGREKKKREEVVGEVGGSGDGNEKEEEEREKQEVEYHNKGMEVVEQLRELEIGPRDGQEGKG